MRDSGENLEADQIFDILDAANLPIYILKEEGESAAGDQTTEQRDQYEHLTAGAARHRATPAGEIKRASGKP